MCRTHYGLEYEKSHPRDRSAWRRDYAERNRAKVLAWKRKSSAKYRARNPEAWRRNAYLRQFGISLEQYEEMLARQAGICAICAGPPVAPGNRLHVDHCHATGRVRGLLCGACNRALGLFKDDAESLSRAAAYLGGAA